MRQIFYSRFYWFILGTILFIDQSFATDTPKLPRLVLQITVDQLRGDLVNRYGAGLENGGFNYLLSHGAVFTDAHHRHANTETVVGHTTLATGTDPAIHGMISNVWIDRKTGATVYNVQDPDYPLVGAAGTDKKTEIDPTQRAATTDGRSPRSILTSTIGDEIRLHFGTQAKVFSVSVKDRAAISMGGHSGQAYWFSKSEGRFVTSSYYRKDYPDWVTAWNASGKVASYAGREWKLTLDRSLYLFADKDDQPWEMDLPGWGRTFPHHYGPVDGKFYTGFLTMSPAGDELTVDFAKALLDNEKLGQDEIPDYLSISLSSTDYVGHVFGPSSLEAEDNIKRLDRTLQNLLEYVDKKVGLDKTLIVLSADHGATEATDYLKTLGIESGQFNFEKAEKEPWLARLRKRFGLKKGGLIKGFIKPYVYLNHTDIAKAGLNLDEVEGAVAEELQKLPGIAYAVTSSSLRRGTVPDTEVMQAVLANFNTDRSGDIHIVFEPHWYVADFDGMHVTSVHGSPWSYDTYVPLIFSGPGIRPDHIYRRVETVDVAATIAELLGTKPPSGSAGVPLTEVFESNE
ncbi:MAG TPA: alkaline phosphatase family protein [Caldithrix abyssi]|uniref:Alkaline phosphatase family protein n=1 Tax=Caldithrix abyssi TaxID=187145 RepID=A0A7V4TZQ1_CALAY|nr:alkaline phosphatase family protein [Caldithrix abyssi]